MKKIIEYRIVQGNSAWVGGRITTLLSEDWVLYGSPYFEGAEHCQAMIKYKKNVVDPDKVINSEPILLKENES